ncbi:MAG TPA: PepSY domain-containing protein, partial [Gammaproteobacteria bacterium]|nr:PepSY domain-containing protein [Gammaproteobacteria bacterium]
LAGFGPAPEEAAMLSVMDRPAYRFGGMRFGPTTVFADTGEILEEIDVDRAKAIARRFLNVPEETIHYLRTVDEPDQWTLLLQRALPLYKFRVDDAAETQVYVSPTLAEVSLLTTKRSRALAWIGTIPHWLYFTPLRVNQPLWYWTVVWAAGLGSLLAVMGLLLGITQFRKSKPFRLSTSIRYVGWMRWHYILGVVFGVFALTWVFSGLLSMEPFAWTNAEGLSVRRDAFTGGPLELSRFAAVDAAGWNRLLDGRTLKEVEFARIQDEPYYLARYTVDAPESKRERLHQPYRITGRTEPDRLLVSASTLDVRSEPFSTESLLTRLRAAAPDAAIVESELLSDYDTYYYSRGRQAPLPVLRAKFDDPRQTWVYIDPQMSEIVAVIHRLNRLERWLYNGLHSLDFAFWYDRRPLWDIGMIVLSVGALATSLIGLFFGVKRLRRDVARLLSRPTSERD